MDYVIIGVDPHKLSATIEVVDHDEKLLGAGRFTTDRAGYAAMRTYAKTWPKTDRLVELVEEELTVSRAAVGAAAGRGG